MVEPKGNYQGPILMGPDFSRLLPRCFSGQNKHRKIPFSSFKLLPFENRFWNSPPSRQIGCRLVFNFSPRQIFFNSCSLQTRDSSSLSQKSWRFASNRSLRVRFQASAFDFKSARPRKVQSVRIRFGSARVKFSVCLRQISRSASRKIFQFQFHFAFNFLSDCSRTIPGLARVEFSVGSRNIPSLRVLFSDSLPTRRNSFLPFDYTNA